MAKKINTIINKGITQATINNALTTDQTTINKHHHTLLKQLIHDETLLEIMIQPDNIQKIKHRLEHRIEIKNNKETKLATANIFNQTTNTTIQQLKQQIKAGDEIQHTEGYIKEGILKQLQTIGWKNIDTQQNGIINRIQLTTIFRKAK